MAAVAAAAAAALMLTVKSSWIRRHSTTRTADFGGRVSAKPPVILTLHDPSIPVPLLLYPTSFISFWFNFMSALQLRGRILAGTGGRFTELYFSDIKTLKVEEVQEVKTCYHLL